MGTLKEFILSKGEVLNNMYVVSISYGCDYIENNNKPNDYYDTNLKYILDNAEKYQDVSIGVVDYNVFCSEKYTLEDIRIVDIKDILSYKTQ